ncbi:MaoC family dehydratase N-terminal domain-containing protein [Paenisporosarcina sp. TG-14]|uniref:MaoC family dehydratase N-terminal domain-containing protein n=1 Tax=Paenisporosarcina sp. TG-14 TaxID=1231057 RepID=UPI0002F95B6C|nr:MaoC family dehydratase N-terminal domain-containing protein [Paenisporosarcina sp. TG-14]
MIDRNIIGKENEPEYHEVEKGAIRKFATAIEDDNPVYHNEEYAKQKGYPSLLAPLTFPTTFRGKIQEWFKNLDKNRLLHGEQEYHYERRFYAGERIKLVEKVADVYEKKGKNGMMTFIIRDREGYDEADKKLFTERSTFIVREDKRT